MEKMPLEFDGNNRPDEDTPSQESSWLKQAIERAFEGQGLMEYALVIFFIAVVVIAVLIILGPSIGSMFSAVTKGFS